jgi:hypothetical protein
LSELSFGRTVAGLGATTDADEAAFRRKAFQQGGDAMLGKNSLESEMDILVGDEFPMSKEFGEAGLYLIVIDGNSLPIGRLADFETPNLFT